MSKVRTINIDGIEVQTSLTPVELADLPQKYNKLQSNWNSLREFVNNLWLDDKGIVLKIRDKMNELEGKDKE